MNHLLLPFSESKYFNKASWAHSFTHSSIEQNEFIHINKPVSLYLALFLSKYVFAIPVFPFDHRKLEDKKNHMLLSTEFFSYF